MGIIKVLDESVSNMIAAGEVVENPASMIKELLENSLDAGSKNIKIDVKNGGKHVIISDDGKGMSQGDLLMSVERHATSKIRKKEDLYNLFTYGFRGEALSSIAAVSKMILSSKDEESSIGATVNVSGGKITGLKEVQRNRGTTIEIKDLFFNTPARLKFLRKATTEYMNIKDIVIQEALGNADVAITLILDDKVSIKTTGNGLDNAVVEIFGNNVLKNCKKFSMGYLGNGSLYRSTKDSIFTFVNSRMVKSKLIENAIIDGYYTKLMKGKYPFAIIFLEIDPQEVDVNVHPSKKIVKFSDEKFIYEKILREIENTFERDDKFVSPTFEEKQEDNSFLDFAEFSKFVPLKAENKQFEDIEVEKYERVEKADNKVEIKESTNLEKNISRTLETDKKSPVKNKKIEEFGTKFEINERENRFNWLEEEKKEENTIENIEEEKPIKEDINNKKIEIKDNNFQKKNKKIAFKVLGQIFNSFILVERDGILEIYDQHIVHERILYEKLKEEYYSSEVSSQQLLVPIRILVDPRERELVFENIESFNKFGFEIDEFGDNEILIRAVPIMNFRDSIENIFREILMNLRENKSKDIRENIIISMSCRGAVKANEKLTQDEMEIMVEKLHEIGEYTCPHGRPIIIKITMNDLEKLFKRK
ncbi:MAG: DNA mismatch repair endonuclease MutL [Fusobacterium sp.]|mgnify:CR=1 FL=1|uniref:DNA mismatch repair endonuclease MutL n=1 Tax=Fusobacterium sp. TaxID=68766 RepID=UPI0029435014|nr:DNA mismatch repair endonuclease MutL [Fusobacterium sp.]MDY3059406.1 DNA mismatch repair endonuclease MutL [Fusobacterium sp.]